MEESIMPTTDPRFVVLTEDELEALLTRAAKRALDLHDQGDELKIRDAARLIRRANGDLYDAVHDGSLPARKEGKAWKVNRKDLLAWNRSTPRGSGA